MFRSSILRVTHSRAAATGRPARYFSTTRRQACANMPSSPSDRFMSALHQNKDWAAKISKEDPQLFPTLAVGQQPEILWIGCSDSRCPETTLLDLKPGDVFVHRNIANVLHASDLSSSAVIEYAVKYLRVKHVVVCGHTSCGGVAAALGNKQLGILDPWLMPLRQLREQHLELLNSLPTDEANLKLVELNVHEGVKTLKQKSVVLDAMQERGLRVHGLIYDVGSGVLRELDTDEPEAAIKARLTSFKTDV
ncbi:carbonic anhydrase [Aspergillus saccharolyticus JOP 1030-1]|uniref:Carbonic anhydrase n=1 Tax=Aspergillus saccharolyticus JOP 1030-1 TaxID=1450539 RepID=A0A318Z3D4_9EURO|nr:carbonic anhydrase [Aspergillus saccharolyticus JOP 1030-1]PYH40827.1 carbonic anhydrase [Aspergillus saccharolyticus JOP 1030-1]